MQARLSASEIDEAWLWMRLRASGWWDTVAIDARANRMAADLDQVRTFCLFIGYPRSGHSLVSSVLDAHPHALFSHRLNSLDYLRRGYHERRLRYLAVRNAQRFGAGGRRLTGYQYDIAGQHQGRFERLLVVGDQEGKNTTQNLADHPELFERLERFEADVRYIHAVRNPFDNISTWAKRTRSTLEEAADRYFDLCQANEAIKARLGAEVVLDVRHERFLAEPAEHVRDLCRFVGLDADADPDYVSACTSIMYGAPNRSREQAPWTSSLIEQVEKRSASFDFLQGYGYDD